MWCSTARVAAQSDFGVSDDVIYVGWLATKRSARTPGDLCDLFFRCDFEAMQYNNYKKVIERRETAGKQDARRVTRNMLVN